MIDYVNERFLFLFTHGVISFVNEIGSTVLVPVLLMMVSVQTRQALSAV